MKRISKELISALVKEAEVQVVERLQLDKLTQLACKAADERFEEQRLMSEDTDHCFYNNDSGKWQVDWRWNEVKERELRKEEALLGFTRKGV